MKERILLPMSVAIILTIGVAVSASLIYGNTPKGKISNEATKNYSTIKDAVDSLLNYGSGDSFFVAGSKDLQEDPSLDKGKLYLQSSGSGTGPISSAPKMIDDKAIMKVLQLKYICYIKIHEEGIDFEADPAILYGEDGRAGGFYYSFMGKPLSYPFWPDRAKMEKVLTGWKYVGKGGQLSHRDWYYTSTIRDDIYYYVRVQHNG